MLVEQHSQERFWLLRRVNFLERMNLLLEEDRDADDALNLVKSFKKVENPSDILARLQEIYGKELP